MAIYLLVFKLGINYSFNKIKLLSEILINLLDLPVFVTTRLGHTGHLQIVVVLVKQIKMKYAADIGLMLFILRYVKLSLLCVFFLLKELSSWN